MTFSAEEVRNNVAENRRFMHTETEAQLLEFAAMLEQREAVTNEPVAVICDNYELRWAGGDAIKSIVDRNGLKVGDNLYASRHARQVPESKPYAGHDTTDAARRQNAEARGWNACREVVLATALPAPEGDKP